jgi:hypothetical protein
MNSSNANQIGGEDLNHCRDNAAEGEFTAFPLHWLDGPDCFLWGPRRTGEEYREKGDLKATKNWLHTSPESKGTAPKSPAWFPSCAAIIWTFPHGVQA